LKNKKRYSDLLFF